MNKYRVLVPVNIYTGIALDINARDEEEAKRIAKDQAPLTGAEKFDYTQYEYLDPEIEEVLSSAPHIEE